MPHKDPEARKAYKKKYEQENREKIRERHRKYHAKRREQTREYHRRWTEAHPDRVKEYYDKYHLKTQYSITPEEYQRRLEQQGSVCACCGTKENLPKRRFAVDHDHETGTIRGLLCHNCNVGIGHLGDTLEGVKRAVAYLERSSRSNLPAQELSHP